MKNTKKLLTWILAILMILVAMGLVACVPKPLPQEKTELILPTLDDGQMAVIIKNGEKDYTNYVVTLTEDMKTVEQVLQYLVDEEVLEIDWTEGAHGKSINAIGGILPDASLYQFVAFFTNVPENKGTYAGAPTYIVGGVQIVSASVGVSQAIAQSGAVVYFELSSY